MTTYWLLGENEATNNNEGCMPIPGPEPIPAPLNNISSPTKNNKSDISRLAKNISNQINNIENKNYNTIPNSSTPLLTNASRDSVV